MNAYELADELDGIRAPSDVVTFDAANMLRQQATYLKHQEMVINDLKAKIAELEKQLQESAMNCISAYAQADDHYARMQELEKCLIVEQEHNMMLEKELEQIKIWTGKPQPIKLTLDRKTGGLVAMQVPQTKPLSDEEIQELANKFIERFEYEPWNVDEIGFARAIEAKLKGQ